MSGPLGGNTHTRLVGQGFKPIDKKLQINSKWGPMMTEKISRADVSDYVYSRQGWASQYSGVPDFEEFWFGKIMAERQDKDTEMIDGHTYSSSIKSAPRILHGSEQGQRT